MSEVLFKDHKPPNLINFDKISLSVHNKIVDAIEAFERNHGFKLEDEPRAKVIKAIERAVWGHIDSYGSRRFVFWKELYEAADKAYVQYKQNL